MHLNIHIPKIVGPVYLVLWHKHTRYNPDGTVASREWLPFSNAKLTRHGWNVTFGGGLPAGFKLMPAD